VPPPDLVTFAAHLGGKLARTIEPRLKGRHFDEFRESSDEVQMKFSPEPLDCEAGCPKIDDYTRAPRRLESAVDDSARKMR
jgi:hypothetical protein